MAISSIHHSNSSFVDTIKEIHSNRDNVPLSTRRWRERHPSAFRTRSTTSNYYSKIFYSCRNLLG